MAGGDSDREVRCCSLPKNLSQRYRALTGKFGQCDPRLTRKCWVQRDCGPTLILSKRAPDLFSRALDGLGVRRAIRSIVVNVVPTRQACALQVSNVFASASPQSDTNATVHYLDAAAGEVTRVCIREVHERSFYLTRKCGSSAVRSHEYSGLLMCTAGLHTEL